MSFTPLPMLKQEESKVPIPEVHRMSVTEVKLGLEAGH